MERTINSGSQDPHRHRHDLRHCVNAVTDEVSKVVGIAAVAIDLQAGRVTATGDGYTDEQIAAAVDETGYSPAGA